MLPRRGDLGYNGERVGTILVSTDRASRGLDSVGVEHVILFDFPRDVSEYVRRVGRTARGANGTGLVSSLVVVRRATVYRVAARSRVNLRDPLGFGLGSCVADDVPRHRLASAV